jgi:hypothetical protein
MLATSTEAPKRVPDEVFVRALSRIQGIKAAFVDDATPVVRLYVVAHELSTELQSQVNRAEDEILEACPWLDLDVNVRATQGRVSPRSLAVGRPLL